MTPAEELDALNVEWAKKLAPMFDMAKGALAAAGYTQIDTWADAYDPAMAHAVVRATCVCKRERLGWMRSCSKDPQALPYFLARYADHKFWDIEAYNGRAGVCRHCSAEIAHEKQERINARQRQLQEPHG